LFDLSTHSVFVSRDVVFHETIFPCHPCFTSSNPHFHDIVLPAPISDNDIPYSSSSNPNPVISIFDLHSVPPVSNHVVDIVPVYDCGIDNVLDSALPLKISSQIKHKPNYLQDCHCQLATTSLSSPTHSPSISGNPFALSSMLSYNKLSPSYKHCSFSFLFT